MENLRIFNQREKMPGWAAVLIKDDPLFNGLRNQSEFKQIVSEVEAKYLADRDRFRTWLIRQDAD